MQLYQNTGQLNSLFYTFVDLVNEDGTPQN